MHFQQTAFPLSDDWLHTVFQDTMIRDVLIGDVNIVNYFLTTPHVNVWVICRVGVLGLRTWTQTQTAIMNVLGFRQIRGDSDCNYEWTCTQTDSGWLVLGLRLQLRMSLDLDGLRWTWTQTQTAITNELGLGLTQVGLNSDLDCNYEWTWTLVNLNSRNAGEIGKNKDLSDFDKGQIVAARQLCQSISETVRLVGCYWSAFVRTEQQWSKEGQTTN